jgi:hypothetical protein
VYKYWNITDRNSEVLGPATQDLTFCLPTERDVNSIRNRLEKLIGETVEREIPADFKGELTQCINSDCDPRWVGDGKCDMSCYNEACRWDGNDCGGPALNSQGVPPAELPATFQQIINAGTPRDSCMLKPSMLTENLEPSMASQAPQNLQNWKFNYWEECNGVGTCSQPGIGQPFGCTCPSNCIFPSGTGSSLPFFQCECTSFIRCNDMQVTQRITSPPPNLHLAPPRDSYECRARKRSSSRSP